MALELDDSTVLITGASSGIGRALARRIAPRARTLALVARRIDRLEALRDELMAAHPKLTVHLLPCDLADVAQTERLLDAVAAQVGAVDVLVNNAGVGDFGVFDRVDWSRTQQMITLNVTSLVLLTHRLVPSMVARGRGGVLNLSSGYGLGFTPGFAAYIGTKHFVTGFTEGLRLDLTGTGVVVTQVCPGPVKTEFADRVGYPGGKDLVPGFAYMSEDACARAALDGFLDERALVVPGLVMKLAWFFMGLTPRFVQRLVQGGFARMLRRQALAAADEPKQLS
jgi:short-subunit dehydrogenase